MIVSYLSCLVCLYIHFILIITLHFQFSIDATNLVRRLPLSDLSTTEARNFIKLNLHLSDLVSYLQPHGGVTRINDRESICLCPFHQDTNPSLRLRDEKQYYHCFSCGAHGDVVTFVMKSQDLSYSAAVRHLIILLESGVLLTKPLPSPSPSLPITSYPINQLHRVTKPTPFKQAIPVVLSKPPVEAAPKPLSVYFDLLRNASNYFSAHLLENPDSADILAYLTDVRSLSIETVKTFQLGFAPYPSLSSRLFSTNDTIDKSPLLQPSLTAFLLTHGFELADMTYVGLTVAGATGHYDRFRDRLMIPIYNAESQLIGFGGRIMDQRIGSKKGISTVRVPAKYINSPASALFSKRHTLYGLPESLPYLRNATQAPALIVEGYFDVISLHQCGVRGTLACLGTALTREQLLLAAYAGITEPGSSPRTVVLLLDEDAAGQRAMHRFCIEVLTPQVGRMQESGLEHISVRVASLSSILSPRSVRTLVKEQAFWGWDSEPVLDRWADSKDVSDLCAHVTASNTTMTRVLNLIVNSALDWRFWMLHRIIQEHSTAAAPQIQTLVSGQQEKRETMWNSPKRALLAASLKQNETAFNCTAVALSEFIVRFQTDHSTVKELVDYASGIISYGFLPEEYSDVRRQLVNTVLAFASRPRSKVDVANFSFLLESENIRNNTNMSIDTINNADVPIENSTTASVTNTSTYVDSSAKSDFNVAQRNATLIRRSAKFTLISKNTSLSPSIATVSSVQKQWKRRSL